jgi:hypothetical protein
MELPLEGIQDIYHRRGNRMARRKSNRSSSPTMTDVALILAQQAEEILAHSGRPFRSIDLQFRPGEADALASVPGLPASLTQQLALDSSDVGPFKLSIDELALTCSALAKAVLEPKNLNEVMLLTVVVRFTTQVGRALAELLCASEASEPAQPPPASQATGAVYQLKITLRHISPPIWRRIQVPDCTLADLHDVIQSAMGWDNYHLYSFSVGGQRYSEPDRTSEMGMANASRAKLSRLIPRPKRKFRYTYDFGDNWEHDILVEKILPRQEGAPYPIVLEGKRACPPEDVGGPWGYMEYLEAIRDPNHERHNEMLEWGGEFDPEAHDI